MICFVILKSVQKMVEDISRKLCGKMISNIPALKENGPITVENPPYWNCIETV